MGNLCCRKRQKRSNIVLLLLGLDNAGKTVAVRNLAGDSTHAVIPTIGFSIVDLTYENFDIKVYDLGGRNDIRSIWDNYYVDAHGVIFVIDSSDHSRLSEAERELINIVSHEKVKGKPLLLLANKQDNEDALDEIDIIEKLDIEQLVNKYECPTLVESCSATDKHETDNKLDPGIKRGYQWILKYIIREYNTLNKRVEHDVDVQKQLEFEEREAKRQRLQELNEMESRHLETSIMDETTSSAARNDLILRIPLKSSCSESSISSTKSSPHMYFGTVEDEFVRDINRPKSTTSVIRRQLEKKSISSTFRRFSLSNRTAPVHLFDRQPKSAHERKTQNKLPDRRLLKSAGDSIFIVSQYRKQQMPLLNGSGDLHIIDYDRPSCGAHDILPPIDLTKLKVRNGDVNMTDF